MSWEINTSQGGTVVRRLTLTSDTGVPINTTGWTWRASVRGSAISLPVTVTVVNPLGVVDVKVTAAQTRLLPHGVYRLGIDWTDALGESPEEEITAVFRVSRDAAL